MPRTKKPLNDFTASDGYWSPSATLEQLGRTDNRIERVSTIEHLASIGFVELLGYPIPDPKHYDEDEGPCESAAECHAKVREKLLSEVKPRPNSNGANWVRRITWPDRVPKLKTWSGQNTLPKLIEKFQAAIEAGNPDDLFAFQWPLKGASGLDYFSAPEAIDVGFSINDVGMKIYQRPGIELLAIVGLECVPLVSFDLGHCGFIHADALFRFDVVIRDGGYLKKLGADAEVIA